HGQFGLLYLLALVFLASGTRDVPCDVRTEPMESETTPAERESSSYCAVPTDYRRRFEDGRRTHRGSSRHLPLVDRRLSLPPRWICYFGRDGHRLHNGLNAPRLS
ncbi:MAG: hypothetical protein JJ992_26815, partial [Planctomycetes bacterium]|nr:hypothetical protein [Planctomycetota bacterium]